MINSILKTIDDIESVTMESKYNVLCALFDSYDKAYIISEEYLGEDIDQFSVFTESWIQEAKDDSTDGDSVKSSRFRKVDEKTGKKESFFKSLFMLIPRLIQLARDVHAEKLEKRKMKKLAKKAKKLNTDISEMDPGEVELFNTILKTNPLDRKNKKLWKKRVRQGIRSYNFRKWLLKMGLTVGGAAIVVGGVAYTINTKGEVISQKVEEYKGKILKKVDEAVLDPIRNAGNAAAEKITDAASKTVEKISSIAEKIENVVNKVVEFIKKIFQNIQKFFRRNIFNYDNASDEILCKIDVKTGSLKVTLNLDQYNKWLDASKTFIVNAAKFISYEVKQGKVVRNNDNKRTGAIADFQKNHDTAKVFKGDDAESAVKRYQESLDSIFDKTAILRKYEPISQFAEMAEHVSDKMAKICSVAKELTDLYEKRVSKSGSDSKWSPAEQAVFQTLRGILDTQIQLTNAIDCVNQYISGVNDLTEEMLNDTPTKQG